MKIEDLREKTIKWEDATKLSLYQIGPNNLLVMAISDGKAVTIRHPAHGGMREGDVWTPNRDSLWFPVEATLSLHGDAP